MKKALMVLAVMIAATLTFNAYAKRPYKVKQKLEKDPDACRLYPYDQVEWFHQQGFVRYAIDIVDTKGKQVDIVRYVPVEHKHVNAIATNDVEQVEEIDGVMVTNIVPQVEYETTYTYSTNTVVSKILKMKVTHTDIGIKMAELGLNPTNIVEWFEAMESAMIELGIDKLPQAPTE